MKNLVTLINELTYFGTRRDQIFQEFDKKFGEDQWAIGWLISGYVEDKEVALLHYEDAYFTFLRDNPKVLDWLVNTASDVYDMYPSNIHSGLDYSVQECDATHLQDIAVRRALLRLEREFEGDHLVQIRDHKSEGYILNPGKVPFHRPELILPRSTNRVWWDPDSVEAFYQHNKVLLVDPERLLVTPEIVCPDGSIIFRHTKSTYYHGLPENQKVLTKIKGKDARRLTPGDKSFQVLRDKEMKPYSHFLENLYPTS